MKKSLIFILLYSFLSISAFGQQRFTSYVALNWMEKSFDNILDEQQSITIQTFEGAAFDAITPEIPRYLHRIALPGKGKLSVNIVPVKTSSINIHEKVSKAVLGKEYISNPDIAQAGRSFQGNISIVPIRKTDRGFEKLEEFKILVTFTPDPQLSTTRDGNTLTSVLSSGTIYKIPVQQEGVYEISGDFIEENLGISNGTLDASDIQIFSAPGGRLPKPIDTERADDLLEIPLLINDGGDGKIDGSDKIIFFVEGANKWNFDAERREYAHDQNVYDLNNYIFLKTDGINGKRIINEDALAISEYTSDEFDFLQIYDEDRTNLLGAYGSTEGTGKEWFGDYFSIETNYSYENRFDLSDVAPSGEARIRLRLAARSATSTTTKLTVGSQVFSKSAAGTNLSNIESDYAKLAIIDEDITINPSSNIEVEFVKSSSKDEAWLDYIQLNYRKNITQQYDQVRLSDMNSLDFSTAAFRVPDSGFEYWDVSDIENARIISPDQGFLGYEVQGSLKSFYMVKSGQYLQPGTETSLVENQNIHAIERADLIIIYPEEFKEAADRLASHRRNHSNYVVETVEINKLYNEFSSGRLDPTSIRDFSRMLSQRDTDFKYLLLIGDATYDYRRIIQDIEDHNFVPAYETDESLDPINGFPSDDYYVLLSDGEGDDLRGAIDVAVGRLPVTTPEMANAVVDKIISYDINRDALGDWRLKIAFAADDEDTNLHVRQADSLAEDVESNDSDYNQTKIYFDTYVQESTPGGDRYPGASEAINTAMQNGTLVMNYMGHGGPKGWAQERVLKIADIETWNNPDRLPILITATCSFTGYDDPSIISAGEAAIQKANGGVLALFTTVRAVYASENERLAQAVFKEIFKKVDGQAQTLGDIIKDAKNKNADSNNILNDRKFSLIGDPSQKIALPRYNIETTKINGQSVSTSTDTLSALDEVTIEGIITDASGNIVSDFNGNIFPTVYDKESIIETLRNDGGSRKEAFEVYRNILFKGSASVTNGEFTFTFVLPKDINYEFGRGRISYYAHDGQSLDAGGYYNDVVIGGSNPEALADDEGPEMGLFMNDENFVFGGSTDRNPTLLVTLSDDLGINVSGTSIGHDITAVLDEDTKNSFILNEFYEANTDDHTSGKVRFPLSNLEPGRHSITVKAWDVSNNSTEERLEFVVIEDDDVSLRRVYNYPNPFTTLTNFQFEHDLAGSDIDVYIDIYSVAGRLVKTIEENIFASGYRVDDIQWNARDEFGSSLGKGLYLYKIKVISRELNLVRESDFEKLVIF